MAQMHQITVKTITYNGLFTTSYILILLSILWFTNTITKLRTLSSIYVIIILLIIDLIKSKYSTPNAQRFASKIDIKRLVLLILSTITFYFVIAILYGAPVLTQHEDTLMFALLMTTCTTCHSLIHVGVKGSVNVFSDLASFTVGTTLHELVLRNVQFSLIGAWGFTLFIPLDWDVPWQEWPIPCCVGALVGYTVGHLMSVCFVVLTKCYKRKRIKSCV